MQSRPYWPLTALTDKQIKAYDEAIEIAFTQAGGSLAKLATRMSNYTGEYISHQAFRNWRKNRNIPVHWALVLEDYTDGKAQLTALVPWLKDRLRQEAA